MPFDPNIDPALTFLNGVQSNSYEQEDPSSVLGSGNRTDNDDDDFPANVANLVTVNSTFLPPLQEFGRLVKKRKEFTERSEADFDTFCATPSIDECVVLLYAAVLENRDLLRAANHAVEERWTISDALQASIRAYSRAFMLSPTLSAYRGNGPEVVLMSSFNLFTTVFRELNIQDVPLEKDLAQTRLVIAAVRWEFTSTRNTIKVKIAASIQSDSTHCNIANLCHLLIGKDAIVPTLQMWMRVAFLRWHVVQYPGIAEENWWLQVDTILRTWRSQLKDEASLSRAFTKMFHDDEALYGNTADSLHLATNTSNLPRWLKVVNEHAATVLGENRASKKRKLNA